MRALLKLLAGPALDVYNAIKRWRKRRRERKRRSMEQKIREGLDRCGR